MTCSDAYALLMDSLDGPLAPPEQASIDEHVAACPGCLRRLMELSRIRHCLQEMGAEEETRELPPLPEDLVQRILSAGRSISTSTGGERRTG